MKRDFPCFLTRELKSLGQRLYIKHSALNGISVACLMDNVMILYAIRNGLSDPAVAVLASFVHLTMPFMLAGRKMISRLGLSATWGAAFFIRYLCTLIIVAAPQLGAVSSQQAVTVLIMSCIFAFGVFRSIATVASTPLLGEITEPEERGALLSSSSARSYTTYLFSLVSIALVLRHAGELWVYQLIIAAGSAVGIYASYVISRIPETSLPKKTSNFSVMSALRNILGSGIKRRLLYAWCAGFVAFSIIIPFMTIALKSGYGISDFKVLTFNLVLIGGAITSSVVNGFIADRTGSRPLFLIYIAGLLLVAVFWALAPESLMALPAGISFFSAGFFQAGIMICLNMYLLNNVEESARIESKLIISMASGFSAGIAGSLVGGGLLNLLEGTGVEGLSLYRYYFGCAAAVLVILLAAARGLKGFADWPVRDVLGLFFSPRDVYALYLLRRLARDEAKKSPSRDIARLGRTGSSLSESRLREMLHSPWLSVRTEALRALSCIPLTKDTEKAIAAEIAGGAFTTGWVAAETAGTLRLKSAIPALREALNSPDHLLAGKSMVSLVQLGDSASYPAVLSLFENSDNPIVIVNGARAVSMMNRGGGGIEILFAKSLDPFLQEPLLDEILLPAAGISGAGADFYGFLKSYNRDKEHAVRGIFRAETAALFRNEDIDKAVDEAAAGKSTDDFRKILEEASSRSGSPEGELLKRILSMPEAKRTPVKTLFCAAFILAASARGRVLPRA